MKLRDLRGLIRNTKGNPDMVLPIHGGLSVSLQKTALLKQLADCFGADGSVETGMTFDAATGRLSSIELGAAPVEPVPASDESAPASTPATTVAEVDPFADDDEDLL